MPSGFLSHMHLPHPDNRSESHTIFTPAHAVACACTVAVGLVIDRHFGWPGQLAVSLWVWAFFLWLVSRAPWLERRVMLRCLVIATAGELLCSVTWGLYDYRLGTLPAFVPPGHTLMLLTGVTLSRCLPASVSRALAATALAVVSMGMALTRDGLSVPLLALFGLLWMAAPAQRPALSIALVLPLALELYGTLLGNWAWRPVDPVFGLPTHNPPWASGALYGLLEVLALREPWLRLWPFLWQSRDSTRFSPARPFQWRRRRSCA